MFLKRYWYKYEASLKLPSITTFVKAAKSDALISKMVMLNDLHYPRLATNNFYFFIWNILYWLLILYSSSDNG